MPNFGFSTISTIEIKRICCPEYEDRLFYISVKNCNNHSTGPCLNVIRCYFFHEIFLYCRHVISIQYHLENYKRPLKIKWRSKSMKDIDATQMRYRNINIKEPFYVIFYNRYECFSNIFSNYLTLCQENLWRRPYCRKWRRMRNFTIKWIIRVIMKLAQSQGLAEYWIKSELKMHFLFIIDY